MTGPARVRAAALLVAAALLGGCASAEADTAPVSVPVPTATVRTVEQNGAGTSVRVVLPALKGGDPTITSIINDRIADKLAIFLDPGSADPAHRRLSVTSGAATGFTHIGAQVASAQTLLIVDTVPPGVEPTHRYDGDTWRLDTGERLSIGELFRGGDLTTLVSAFRMQLDAKPDAPTYPAGAIAPVAGNFDQFVVDPDGLTIWTVDGRFGHGSLSVTVPWRDIRDAMDPAALAVVTS